MTISPGTQERPHSVPLHVALDSTCRGLLRGALQRGVAVPAVVPCPLSRFLVDQLGIDPNYVGRRISTIFLDGEVVDSPDTATLRDRSVLALSAALPGLVGATLRKGGYYAAMRSDITRAADVPARAAAAPGVVSVKLFNLLIDELAGTVLRHGILLGREESVSLLGALGRTVPASPPGVPFFLTATEPREP